MYTDLKIIEIVWFPSINEWLILGNRKLRYSSILVWNDMCSGRTWNPPTENNPEIPVFSCQCMKAALLAFHPSMALIIFFKPKPPCLFLVKRTCQSGKLHHGSKLVDDHCFTPGLFFARLLLWSCLISSLINRCVSKMHRADCVKN